VNAKVQISKPKPFYGKHLRNLPGMPVGERILIRPWPPEEVTEGGIVVADVAKEWINGGTIIGMGDEAAEKLHDRGVYEGDEITYGKYAGVIQEWQHIVPEGEDESCAHDGAWDVVQKLSEESWLRECRGCKTRKITERIIMADAGDVIMSITAQERIERGEMHRVPYTDPETGCRKYRTEKTNKNQTDTHAEGGQ